MPQITIQFVNLTFILSLPLPSTVMSSIPWYSQISSDVTDAKQVKNKQVKIFIIIIKLTIQNTATQGHVSTQKYIKILHKLKSPKEHYSREVL